MARVLLIEPNAALANTYKRACEQAGYIVDVATSAQQAIACADEHTPGVVVLELQLAAHSGIEFLYEFQSYPEWQYVPVIVQSYMPLVRLAALRAGPGNLLGIKACLYKPQTSLDKLLQAVRAQLVVA